MKESRRCILIAVLAALLAGCGGGGGSSPEAQTEATPHISSRGFADSGIFVGDLDGTEVLLVMDSGDYFLLAGSFASRCRCGILRVSHTG